MKKSTLNPVITGQTLHNFNAEISPSELEWVQLGQNLSESQTKILAALIDKNKERLVGIFYDRLLQNTEATPFLSQEIVHDRLRHSMRGWLYRLFVERMANVEDFVAEQRKIGAVHARIQVPIHLVMQGARILENEIIKQLQNQNLNRTDFEQLSAYVNNNIDIAIEFMSQAFVSNTKSDAKTDEAYRVFALSQDMSLERESQRAALMEWSQSVLFSLYSNKPDTILPTLAASDFGLWLHHKGDIIFQGAPALQSLRETARYIDNELLPDMTGQCQQAARDISTLIETLKNKTNEMKFLLSELFQSAVALETGRDPLTRTLNRRFLPSILSREVKMATKNKINLGVMMLDIDNFKIINDSYGHSSGDHILQQVAEIILSCSRSSDFVFRYGGEEFLIILIEADQHCAVENAERLRKRIESQPLTLPDGSVLSVTLSIGVSVFNGHPDYNHLIEAADQALYKAKQNGRNRTEIATVFA